MDLFQDPHHILQVLQHVNTQHSLIGRIGQRPGELVEIVDDIDRRSGPQVHAHIRGFPVWSTP